MKRDIAKYKSFDKLYTNEKGQITNPSYRNQYGYCKRFEKEVSFIPNIYANYILKNALYIESK